ncbi:MULTISPECIES: YjiH family protein [Paeniglutamicibacter]|uniref:Nucleoside recognition membrane protein YjiH n=1 Tax=Paeniglutamicibacter sulfureus TaxID=43666 RepID=A0ABU2BFK8_9MICC|nr:MULTISPECIES: YjiH family protein [Paeniglutamicibacter]MCV9992824.1 YjiH family protein [Paeniglutamicibacter sp. ZC-3]MDR7357406.1 nucleoside recognition membrane protein YjiH [Paeniglutamicibacter sulfureus]
MSGTNNTELDVQRTSAQPRGKWRFFVYSLIGVFMFFIPITIGGKETIPLDHLVGWIIAGLGDAVRFVALALILAGTIYPFASGRWRESGIKKVFAFLNIIGLVVGTMLVFKAGPALLFEPDLGPFLFDKLVIPVGMIVPVGAIFLALLVGYGLMEFVGVLVQRVMRPIWRTPGRSAVDAVASFVGSYSLGLLITDRMYQSGRYTARESAIIATGFSTVSVTFMVIVAKTLDIMHLWLPYFFLSFGVTFLVTAICVRLPPLSRIKDDYYPQAVASPEEKVTTRRLATAWNEAMGTLADAPSLGRNIWVNFRDGLLMAMAILPSILSVGLIGLLLARFTPIFDWLGYIFVPITWAVGLPDPVLAAKASAVGIAEMFLPATVVAGHESEHLRLVIGVVCVSAIIFFSAVVPCILATRIPLKVWHLVVIWAQRVALTLLIASPVAFLMVGR